MTVLTVSVKIVLIASAVSLFASAAASGSDSDWAAAALAGDRSAAASLREAGPAGLTALLTAAEEKRGALLRNETRLDDPAHAAFRATVDTVAGQRDAYSSGLYWFTDLEAAKTEARRSGRPILSLRLLGKLDEEYSCANSRFFRTVLYANHEVSRRLREHYVLHWKSVRPAPLLTIDMGDGRRIRRTITGNSIHYLLDSGGAILDAFPGLYGPAAFLAALRRAEAATEGKSPRQLRAWHGGEAHNLCMEWLDGATQAGVYGERAAAGILLAAERRFVLQELFGGAFPASGGELLSKLAPRVDSAAVAPPEPDHQAKRFAFEGAPSISSGFVGAAKNKIEYIREFPFPTEFDPAKAMVERPVLRHSLPDAPAVQAQDPASPAKPGLSLAARMTPAVWSQIAEPLRAAARLDEASRRLMTQKLAEGSVTEAEFRTGTPAAADSPFARMLDRFEASLARDMARNEYYYHTQIHQWLEEDADGSARGDLEAFNKRVYDELFLTPDHDAWLGLVPEDTYNAIEKDGCACDPGAAPMRRQS